MRSSTDIKGGKKRNLLESHFDEFFFKPNVIYISKEPFPDDLTFLNKIMSCDRSNYLSKEKEVEKYDDLRS